MNTMWVAYSKVHEYLLDRSPTNKTYQDRIIAQKVGYMSKAVGIYLGELDFFWHKRGPYSRALAANLRYMEREKEEIQERCAEVKIKETVKPKLDKLKKIIVSKPYGCSEAYWLEICASLLFLKNEYKTNDINLIKEVLIRKKPFLKDFQLEIYEAWDILNNNIAFVS